MEAFEQLDSKKILGIDKHARDLTNRRGLGRVATSSGRKISAVAYSGQRQGTGIVGGRQGSFEFESSKRGGQQRAALGVQHETRFQETEEDRGDFARFGGAREPSQLHRLHAAALRHLRGQRNLGTLLCFQYFLNTPIQVKFITVFVVSQTRRRYSSARQQKS